MKLAPITIFVYNRPWHIWKTIEALQKNVLANKSELFIFSDGPKDDDDKKKVEEVRRYIRTISGFKKVSIVERKTNYGLAKSIIDGVTDIVNEYGNVIVLEDDLITSNGFLKFMNKSLKLYKNNNRIGMVSGYVFPLKAYPQKPFFLRGGNCWGWATWKRAWSLFETNSEIILSYILKNNLSEEFDYQGYAGYITALKKLRKGPRTSWAILWYGTQFMNLLFAYHPNYSLIQNMGFDGSGEHCDISSTYQTKTVSSVKAISVPVCESAFVRKELTAFYRSRTFFPTLFVQKVLRRLNIFT